MKNSTQIELGIIDTEQLRFATRGGGGYIPLDVEGVVYSDNSGIERTLDVDGTSTGRVGAMIPNPGAVVSLQPVFPFDRFEGEAYKEIRLRLQLTFNYYKVNSVGSNVKYYGKKLETYVIMCGSDYGRDSTLNAVESPNVYIPFYDCTAKGEIFLIGHFVISLTLNNTGHLGLYGFVEPYGKSIKDLSFRWITDNEGSSPSLSVTWRIRSMSYIA